MPEGPWGANLGKAIAESTRTALHPLGLKAVGRECVE